MKTVKIKYNPYLLKTDISIDGSEPKANSSLHFGKQRLQEWAEKFVAIFLDEYRDANVSIEFTGSLTDYNDLKETIEASADKISVKNWVHNCVQDVEEVENKVYEIFNEIQDGPVDALKDEAIINAFTRATSALFGINVVATMSAGKSTLINALLGKKLMPMAQKATTATIVSIIASDQDNFEATAKDKDDNIIAEDKNITYETMKEWNMNEKISSIDIYGPIPCVDNIGMRLVLIDTPGPNNSRDERHKAMTYGMLDSSEKSVVLFVMNSTQSGTDDEASVLDYVCTSMKKGGKQSRERYIFAVNKLDDYKPGEDCVEGALNDVKKILDDRDITNPNLFPAASLPCLQLRDAEEYPDELDMFKSRLRRSDEFKLDSYYNFNHLPTSSKSRLERSDNGYSDIEVHTGIPSIEEAIRLYINKYARVMKVKDLVDSFNLRLIELQAKANLEKSLRDNKAEKERLLSEIESINHQIDSGKSSKVHAELINKIDVSKNVKSEVDSLVGGFQTRIDKIITGYTNKTKISKSEAKSIINKLQRQRGDIIAQLESRIQSIFNSSFKLTYDSIIAEYRKKLSELGYKTDASDFEFSPIDLIGEAFLDLDDLIADATSSVDQGDWKEEWKKVGSHQEKLENHWYKPWEWFTERYETVDDYDWVKTWESKWVEYVNMHEVVSEYYSSLYASLIEAREDIPSHIAQETKRLKKVLNEQIKKVDQLLSRKLKELQESIDSKDKTQAEIKKQESDLEWMNGIINRVNNLINF